MREYYEELWQNLPDPLQPPDRELRVRFARAHVAAGERVLDLGCGDGWMCAELESLGATPLGVEVAAAAVERAWRHHPGLEFRLAEIDGALPLEDNAFDVVWASEVIEHVADTARWLSEVRRVLRPRGRLLLTTPNHSRLQLLAAGIERYSEPLGDHLHLYVARSLRSVLDGFGFAEIEISGAGGPRFARRMLCASAVR
ncbi:MAG TPA: class I SAM-dependent methyltransferase [Solirubrobacteraceae bacterium]|jgi:2-polyprenyl-3-methyl-5-hydroxy-6-metoxy-1,4-benzoquinol methylase